MAAIWRNDGTTWRLMAPQAFPDEAMLHRLVEEGPQTVPLSGSPQLVVVGKEVRLGNAYADLIAVETSGRIAIIEIKLARNAEARRAVVAQVLAYAAYLDGLTVEDLESAVLVQHLTQRGFSDIGAAVEAADQVGRFNREDFYRGLRESLAEGNLRLVIVLDSAPEELVRIVGFLEKKAPTLLVDLVSMSAYEVDGSTILVPQRIDPGNQNTQPEPKSLKAAQSPQGELFEGAEEFERGASSTDGPDRSVLQALIAWARALESRKLATLETYQGKLDRATLLPRLQPDGVGLITIWNEKGPAIQFWRSVFERRAPKALIEVEACIAPAEVRQGNTIGQFSEDLLPILTRAYEEANSTDHSAPTASKVALK